MEVDAMFAEPLRRARSLGLATPYLALIAAQMQSLDRLAAERREAAR